MVFPVLVSLIVDHFTRLVKLDLKTKNRKTMMNMELIDKVTEVMNMTVDIYKLLGLPAKIDQRGLVV